MFDKLNTNNLITPNELAKFLKMSRQSVYRLVEKGELPCYKISGSLRFKAKDVENYLDEVRFDLIDKQQ